MKFKLLETTNNSIDSEYWHALRRFSNHGFLILLGALLMIGCHPSGKHQTLLQETGTPPTDLSPSLTYTQLPTPTSTVTPIPPSPTPTRTQTKIPTNTPTLTATQEEQNQFVEYLVAEDLETISGVFIHDIDGDGDNDILGAAIFGDEVAWWSNIGGNPITWEKQSIDSEFDGAVYVYAIDMDGDADVDVLATAALAGEVAWWRNDGGYPITWTKQIVAGDLMEPHGIIAADINRDGYIDIIGTDAGSNQVIWWQSHGHAGANWTTHIITEGFDYTQTLDIADLDGDGDLDVIAGGGQENAVTWWRNDGGEPIVWTKQKIRRGVHWPHWVHVSDIDGDGLLDVLGAAYSDQTILWWQNSGSDPIEWEQQKIDADFPYALTVHSSDLDGDGDIDVIAAGDRSSEISWWRNNGGTPLTWTKLVLSAKFYGAWGLHAGDIDGDGDYDIVGGSTREIVWWENTQIE